jgi:hypothetical protein
MIVEKDIMKTDEREKSDDAPGGEEIGDESQTP